MRLKVNFDILNHNYEIKSKFWHTNLNYGISHHSNEKVKFCVNFWFSKAWFGSMGGKEMMFGKCWLSTSENQTKFYFKIAYFLLSMGSAIFENCFSNYIIEIELCL